MRWTAADPFVANSHIVQNRHAVDQATHWDIQNKENSSLTGRSRFVLDVPVHNMLSSMADSVPCDR